MNRIGNAFQKKTSFMPYSPLGYPDLEISIDVIEVLAKHGAHLIEVGLSFSDPLANGPVIQPTTQIALKKGITVKKSLEAMRELRKRGAAIPLVLMEYYNPIPYFPIHDPAMMLEIFQVAEERCCDEIYKSCQYRHERVGNRAGLHADLQHDQPGSFHVDPYSPG